MIESGLGCYLNMTCFSILLYADDIVLLAPSVHSLQLLLHTCEDELSSLDMRLNIKKSVCIRIGPRYKADCCNLVTRDNCELLWCNNIRYLGVYTTSSAVFTCCLSDAMHSIGLSIKSPLCPCVRASDIS